MTSDELIQAERRVGLETARRMANLHHENARRFRQQAAQLLRQADEQDAAYVREKETVRRLESGEGFPE